MNRSARALAVWRGWRRAERAATLPRWWRHWRLGDGAFFVQMGCAAGILACEAALWPVAVRREIAEAARIGLPVDAGALGWSLLALAAGNALWAFRVLRVRRLSPDRPGAAAAGVALAAPPLFGVLVLPLWQRNEERRREEGAVPAGGELPRRPPRAARRVRPGAAAGFAGRALRRLEATWLPLLWLGPLNLLWVIAATAWLLARADRPPLGPPVLLAVAASLHLLGFASARIAAAQPATTESLLRRRRSLEALWLFPSPLPQTWFLIALAAGSGRRRGATLAHAALLGRGFTGASVDGERLAERVRAEWRERPAWQRWRQPGAQRQGGGIDNATRRALAVGRWKTAGLALDGFALAAASPALGFAAVDPGGALAPWYAAALVAVVLAFGAVLLLWSAQQVARRLGFDGLAALDRQPYLRGAAFGLLALALGLVWGGAAAVPDPRLLIMALAYGWSLGVVAVAFGGFLNPARLVNEGRRDPRDPWFWLAAFTALPLVPAALVWIGGGTGPGSKVGVIALVASVVWSAVVVSTGRSALCHPVRPDRLRDPSVPAAVRGALRLVLVTAALPLGGLAVPVWWFLRERHRAEIAALAAREAP